MLAGLGTNDTEWTNIVSKLRLHLNRGASVTEFAAALGQEKEVSGYMYHTVPVVLYAWHRHFGDYRATLSAVLDCGGDTDTTGAIVGALAGLTVGESGIPPEWINGISEWPRSVSLCRRIANRLAEQKQSCKPAGPIWYFWPGTVPRNIVFLIIVLCHGFRRLW
jgi:ADP-ribosylglycohydrolase